MGQAILELLIETCKYIVLIKNSKTAWLAKILIPFSGFSDNYLTYAFTLLAMVMINDIDESWQEPKPHDISASRAHNCLKKMN